MPRVLTIVALTAALAGCSKKPAEFIELPFCTSEAADGTPRFAHDYMFLVAHSNGHLSAPLRTRTSGPLSQGFVFVKQVELAVIECPQGNISLPDGWHETLGGGDVPNICPQQRELFHGPLELEQSERAKALGLGGFFRVPPLDVACIEGTPIQRERYTFGQIIAEFQRAVDRYHELEGGMPASLDVLYDKMKEPTLPTDPWGTALRFDSKGGVVTLTSAGADKSFETADDVEVLHQQSGGSASILGWSELDYPGWGSYEALLERVAKGEVSSP